MLSHSRKTCTPVPVYDIAEFMNPEESKVLTPEARPPPQVTEEEKKAQGTAIAPTQYFPDQKSGWTSFLRIMAVLSLIAGLLGCIMFLSSDNGRPSDAETREAFIVAALGLGSCIQLFLFAFLVDVFTDIRWYLSKLSQPK